MHEPLKLVTGQVDNVDVMVSSKWFTKSAQKDQHKLRLHKKRCYASAPLRLSSLILRETRLDDPKLYK